ncbi:MAG TPA: GNAT family protein [Mycobacteriales bacterium]|jgi:RimJ/RimL family protein N-acetyltransferase|nr:GNAT family protein [Mycobacteriales bacterium]
MTRLRPLQLGDVDVLEAQYTNRDAAGEHNWFGFREPGMLRRHIESLETLRPERGQLAVVDDEGHVVGEVGWVKTFNGPPPNGDCWNLGIWIVPEHRGRGYGTEAQRLGAAYLFEHTMMERVEAGTELSNVAEQRALEKAGFTREGVLRRACFRGGAWQDMVVFSKLRGEA